MAFDPLPNPSSFATALLDIERRLGNLDNQLRALRFTATSADTNLSVTANGLVEVVQVVIKPAAVAVPDLTALASKLLALVNQAFTAANARAASDTATATAAFNLLGLCVPNGPMPNFEKFQDNANALLAEDPNISQRVAAMLFTGVAGGVTAVLDGTLRVTSLVITVLPDFLPALEQDVADAINRARAGARDGVDKGIRDNTETVPNSVSLLNLCLYARGGLFIEDRVFIKKQGGFAAVANGATGGTTNVGVQAQVGDIWSRSPVFLRNNCQITGSVKSSRAVDKQQGANVTGQTVENVLLQVPNPTLVVTFPSNQGPIDLQPTTPPTTLNILPGAWSSVAVKRSATLGLKTGTYFFDSLTIEPGGILALDSNNGQVIVYLKTGGFTFRGKLIEKTAPAPRLFVGSVGGAGNVLGAPFTGTVVAPDGSITFDTVASPWYSGSFFAKDITVRPDNTVTWIPFLNVPPLNTF